MNNFCVITTVNKPTLAIEKLHELFGANLIVVGDKKTPAGWNYKDAQYILDLPIGGQWYEGYAPLNHYARKNLGYLEAIRRGAEVIYSTDDDNCPNINWKIRTESVEACKSAKEGWCNIYKQFSNEHIWPRGFSLRHLESKPLSEFEFDTYPSTLNSSIQQGLADGEPDVDAIWRLALKKEICFKGEGSGYLKANSWCPFNSQSTWFFKKAFPLMYLPVNASFRMTDIWSSFVAQRCLWELGEGVTFHSPSEVYQDRNEHDLLADFKDEVPGYLNNDKIVEILSGLQLKQGEQNTCDNLLTCYQALVDNGILPEMEIRSLKKWIKDYEAITRNMG